MFSVCGVAHAVTGLPWSSGFETGDFSEWNGYKRGPTLTTSTANPAEGSYCATVQLSAGTLNNNYLEHYFGDHQRVSLDKVEELYLEFKSKFSSGYSWPERQSHKVALLNLTDGITSDRRYQVYVYVNNSGRYVVDHSYIDSWRFFGLSQNVGDPAYVRFDQWDKIKLYVRLNTPGASDGIVKMWINDELKLDYTDVNIREDSSFGVNKLILSSYTSHQSGSNGTQWYDDWRLSETDIDSSVAPPSPPVMEQQ
jgi:hypothetical protein